MGRDSSSVRAAGRHDHPDRHRRGIPPALSGNRPRQPPTPVRGPDQVVHVHDVRLELDDEKCPPFWVPCQDVDDPALAVDRVGDFGRKNPRRNDLSEPARHQFVQRRVPSVQQAVQVTRPPPRHEIHADVEFARHLLDRRDRQRPNVSSFDPADRRVRHSRAGTEIRLGPVASLAQQPDRGTESALIHQGTMIRGTYPALIGCPDVYGPSRRPRGRRAGTHRRSAVRR